MIEESNAIKNKVFSRIGSTKFDMFMGWGYHKMGFSSFRNIKKSPHGGQFLLLILNILLLILNKSAFF
jgi:hypothetical protein